MTFSSILVGVVKARGDEYDFRARFESFIKEYASADSLTAGHGGAAGRMSNIIIVDLNGNSIREAFTQR